MAKIQWISRSSNNPKNTEPTEEMPKNKWNESKRTPYQQMLSEAKEKPTESQVKQ